MDAWGAKCLRAVQGTLWRVGVLSRLHGSSCACVVTGGREPMVVRKKAIRTSNRTNRKKASRSARKPAGRRVAARVATVRKKASRRVGAAKTKTVRKAATTKRVAKTTKRVAKKTIRRAGRKAATAAQRVRRQTKKIARKVKRGVVATGVKRAIRNVRTRLGT